MFPGEDGVDLRPEHLQKPIDGKPMPGRREGGEIFFREPKQSHRGIHPPPILRVSWPRMLFLQMNKRAGRLDESFEIIRVRGFRPQPKVLEHVMRVVVTLLIPAAKESEIARMPRDFVGRVLRRRAARFGDQSGNSLAFVHGKLSLDSAEMTGNRARIVFPRRARVRQATVAG